MGKPVYRGHKTKFAANISGIGNLSPEDESVDFTLIFYIPNKPGKVEIPKSQCTFDGSTPMFLLDVTPLEDGRLNCFAELKYEEEGFSEPIDDGVIVRLDQQYDVCDAPVHSGEDEPEPETEPVE